MQHFVGRSSRNRRVSALETPNSAATKILSKVERLNEETVRIENAICQVLAIDITSRIDIPHWNNSAMDGYAALAADLEGAPPHELRIVDYIPAGSFPSKSLGTGECARVFTGAPVPDNADTVIRQEDTSGEGSETVLIDDLRDVGRNIRKRGEDVKKGELVLPAGTELGPAEIGMLASLGEFDVPVYRKPVVAIMGSGDEIADRDERSEILAGKKIGTSNTYALAALVRENGGEPLVLGVGRDDPEDLKKLLLKASQADLIITTAGVSVGEHDFLHQVLEELDTDRVFWRIQMRPGSPVVFGTVGKFGGTPWIGLPGNPVSTLVTFELFVRPTMRKMMGHRLLFRDTTQVSVKEPIQLGPKLTHFLRVKLERTERGVTAALTGGQGSGILSSMLHADGLLIIPPNQPHTPADTTMPAIVLNDHRHVENCPW